MTSVHGYYCFFFSFVLFLLLPLSLPLSQASHTWWWVNKVSPSSFLFVSVTDHERALSLMLFWAGLCITKATKCTECQSSHLHFCLCVPWAKASCQPGTQMPRREHEMIPWTVKRYASPFHAAHNYFILPFLSSCASCNDFHFCQLNLDISVGLYFKNTIITKSMLISLVAWS